jgi:hypothetical protein
MIMSPTNLHKASIARLLVAAVMLLSGILITVLVVEAVSAVRTYRVNRHRSRIPRLGTFNKLI